MIQIFDMEQGGDDWFAARLGIPTASNFATVMAKGEGKTRKSYLLKLAGEILTGEPAEPFTNVHMERGKVMEDEARDLYAFMKDADLHRVGFVRNGEKGCSPDSLIGADGGLEIKTALAHIQVERLLKGELPTEHKAQVQGGMWVCEREWWDFVSYWPKLPPLIVRVKRDNGYIANLVGEIDRFNDELAATVERIRRYGQPSTLMQDLKASAELLGAAG
jgi:hypothetical protein